MSVPRIEGKPLKVRVQCFLGNEPTSLKKPFGVNLETTGCGLVRAPAPVFVPAAKILKQLSNFKKPVHNESKLVLLYFIKKINKMH